MDSSDRKSGDLVSFRCILRVNAETIDRSVRITALDVLNNGCKSRLIPEVFVPHVTKDADSRNHVQILISVA